MYFFKNFTVLVAITLYNVRCDGVTDVVNESTTPLPDLNETNSIETSTSSEIETVKVEVYYESLCPYCERFFVNKLEPVVQSMHQYLDIKLYPFGNADIIEEDDHYRFRCQHGKLECYGNKLHACAIDILKNVTKSTLFNCCLFEFFSDDESVDECATRMKLNGDPIKECAKGSKGNELLKYYGDETNKIYFRGVPHIRLNGIPYRNSSKKIFKDYVCAAFKNPPPPCNTVSTTSASTDE
ncbi:GILT-like protein 2 [Manduca sexta]|uniref:GILT-like protein 2 n=1 Tax=Manduca sexta TaxID=7130 RepID=UPI00188E7DDE|nr:GILT-like protein 2 [Manduca sexta]